MIDWMALGWLLGPPAAEKGLMGAWGWARDRWRRRRAKKILAEGKVDWSEDTRISLAAITDVAEVDLRVFGEVCEAAVGSHGYQGGYDLIKFDAKRVVRSLDSAPAHIRSSLARLQSRALVGVDDTGIVNPADLNGLTISVRRDLADAVVAFRK